MYYESKSLYLSSSRFPASNFLRAADAHQFPTATINPVNTSTSWTVAKTASGSYSSMTASTAATVFSTTIKPNETLNNTAGEGWISGPYLGVFAKNTMSVQWNVIATTVNSQQGHINYRIWKSTTPTCQTASLITPTVRKTNIGVLVSTGGLRVSGSFNMTGSVIMNNEYLVLETAWAITTAGGSNNSDVIVRAGSGSFLKTGPFEDNTFILQNYDYFSSSSV